MSNVTALVGYLPADSVEYVIEQWKMSTAEASQLRWTYAHLNDILNPVVIKADIVNGTPREWYLDLISVSKTLDDRWPLYQQVRGWLMPVFPVTGNDLIEFGMKPGKLLGDTLKQMKTDWVASDYTMTRLEMLEWLGMYQNYAS